MSENLPNNPTANPVAKPAVAASGAASSGAAAPAAPAAAVSSPKPAAPQAAPPPPAPPPPPPPVPKALSLLAIPFQGADFVLKGYHAEATVAPDRVVAAAEALDKEGFSLDTITGVDWMAQAQMEVVYDYFHPLNGLRAVVRARIPREKPELPTISAVFPGANWHERETHDFFGIVFIGHPNLTPFLLPEDATFHPLRKDFVS
jgi:NADH-quinone oxidoreductase subunit C